MTSLNSEFHILWCGTYELKKWKEEYEEKLEKGIRIDYDKYKKIRSMYGTRHKKLVKLLERINMRNKGFVTCMPSMSPPPYIQNMKGGKYVKFK